MKEKVGVCCGAVLDSSCSDSSLVVALVDVAVEVRAIVAARCFVGTNGRVGQGLRFGCFACGQTTNMLRRKKLELRYQCTPIT